MHRFWNQPIPLEAGRVPLRRIRVQGRLLRHATPRGARDGIPRWAAVVVDGIRRSHHSCRCTHRGSSFCLRRTAASRSTWACPHPARPARPSETGKYDASLAGSCQKPLASVNLLTCAKRVGDPAATRRRPQARAQVRSVAARRQREELAAPVAPLPPPDRRKTSYSPSRRVMVTSLTMPQPAMA